MTSTYANNLNTDYKLSWKKSLIPYQTASVARSVWQILNTLVPYIGIWIAMYYCVTISWWLVVPLAILASGFLIRLFIIFHDCGHGSFFNSKKANNILGFILGVITFTPYYQWRWEHGVHHASSGNLDKRGTGDIWTMTVEEYLNASPWKKFSYRLARNPIVLFIIAPTVLFLFWQRIPNKRAPQREKRSVHYTNIGLVLFFGTLMWIFGWKNFLIIQGIISVVSAGAGVWLFYVQHQYEGVYWARSENWNVLDAALKGSSFYKLPKILQWFSGNIGFHHIHHLNSRIPNYNLEKCHKTNPLFQTVQPITLFASRKSFGYRFWDEKRKQLIGYKHLRALQKN